MYVCVCLLPFNTSANSWSIHTARLFPTATGSRNWDSSCLWNDALSVPFARSKAGNWLIIVDNGIWWYASMSVTAILLFSLICWLMAFSTSSWFCLCCSILDAVIAFLHKLFNSEIELLLFVSLTSSALFVSNLSDLSALVSSLPRPVSASVSMSVCVCAGGDLSHGNGQARTVRTALSAVLTEDQSFS